MYKTVVVMCLLARDVLFPSDCITTSLAFPIFSSCARDCHLRLEVSPAKMDTEKDHPTKPVVAPQDADDALKFISEGEVIAMTAEDEKKLVRKIDMTVLPLLCVS